MESKDFWIPFFARYALCYLRRNRRRRKLPRRRRWVASHAVVQRVHYASRRGNSIPIFGQWGKVVQNHELRMRFIRQEREIEGVSNRIEHWFLPLFQPEAIRRKLFIAELEHLFLFPGPVRNIVSAISIR
jgi:hypothetical protein